jgi:acyl-CoA synthetase (AMP-forming)/AMP-acid ligase II
MFPMATLMHGGLERAADRYGDRDAIRAGDDRWSFRDLDGLANAFARHLVARGVEPGDRVAVMMANRPEFVVTVTAMSKIGAAAVLLSPAWKAAEVDHALELTAGPRHAVADGAGASLLADRLGSDGVTDLEDPTTFEAATTHGRDRPPGGEARATDDVILVFSSGTTGSRRRSATRTPRSAGRRRTGARRWDSVPTTGSRWPHRHRTYSASSTCSPPWTPARRCGCTAGSTSTRCCTASPPSA